MQVDVEELRAHLDTYGSEVGIEALLMPEEEPVAPSPAHSAAPPALRLAGSLPLRRRFLWIAALVVGLGSALGWGVSWLLFPPETGAGDAVVGDPQVGDPQVGDPQVGDPLVGVGDPVVVDPAIPAVDDPAADEGQSHEVVPVALDEVVVGPEDP
jgi:hypothetical protein